MVRTALAMCAASLNPQGMLPDIPFRRLLEKHELAAGILGVINGYLGDRGLSLVVGVNLVTDLPAVHRFSKTVLTGRRVPGIKQELVQGLGGCGFQRSVIPD